LLAGLSGVPSLGGMGTSVLSNVMLPVFV
jgi:hypothetical protein